MKKKVPNINIVRNRAMLGSFAAKSPAADSAWVAARSERVSAYSVRFNVILSRI